MGESYSSSLPQSLPLLLIFITEEMKFSPGRPPLVPKEENVLLYGRKMHFKMSLDSLADWFTVQVIACQLAGSCCFPWATFCLPLASFCSVLLRASGHQAASGRKFPWGKAILYSPAARLSEPPSRAAGTSFGQREYTRVNGAHV